MKKSTWGNAVWFLFHTLAEKIKPEHKDEYKLLLNHITGICSHLPCPDCQQHSTRVMLQVNQSGFVNSKETLIDFLWKFHNDVNKRTKKPEYSLESLNKYKSAVTSAIVKNFIMIMSATSNNEKTMMYGFHRMLYMKNFITYINANTYKYNP